MTSVFTINCVVRRIVWTLAASALLTSVGCNTNDVDDEQIIRLALGSFNDPTAGFWTERQGIGPDWYKFSQSNNLNYQKKNVVYAVVGDVYTTFVNVASFTDNIGSEGYFTLDIANDDGPIITLKSDIRVFEQQLCLSFKPAKFVDCNSENVDAILSAPIRYAIDADDAVINPSIIVTPKAGRKTFAVGASSIDKLGKHRHNWRNLDHIELPDVYSNPAASRLAAATENEKVHLLMSPDRKVTAFAFKYRGDWAPHFEYACSSSNSKKQPLAESPTYRLDLDNIEYDAVYGLSLCDRKLERVDKLHGLTPMNSTYQLFLIIAEDGRPSLTLAPHMTSWAYGERYDVSRVDQVRSVVLDAGNVGFFSY